MARPRILVVDDDAAQRRAVERVLDSAYDVTTVPGGDDALAVAEPGTFDLALLDVRMPGMDGLDLLGRLKTADPAIDAILMTGSATDTDARLVRAMRGGAFYFVQKPFHREVLLALVQRCLEGRRLHKAERAHADRMTMELEAARRFQTKLLPGATAEYPGLELAAHYEPSLELCGDFYEHAPREDGVAILVADVAGKGVGAAMLTGMVKQAFRSSEAEGYAPAIVLQRAFSGCQLYPGGRHLTACAARVDPRGDKFELIVTAGHPPAYIVSKEGGLERLEASADPLHPAYSTWRFEQRTHALKRGDVLVACTDGLLEARRAADDEMFDVERLETALRAAPRDSAAALIESLRESLRAFQEGRPPDDDLTILAARRV